MPTTLFRGGRVRTPVDPFATALLVEGTTVAWVGSDDAAAQLTADVVVDLADAVVLPAFVDAHVHTTATGLDLAGPDLAAVTSARGLLDVVAAALRTFRGDVLLAGGWDESGWPAPAPPPRAELAVVAGDRLVYLARADLHSALASPALCARAGVGPEAPWPLRGAEHHAVRRAANAAVGAGQREAAQRAARAAAAALGIGSLHEMAGPEVSSADDLAGLLALAAAEPGPEIVGWWGGLGEIATALELGAVGAGGDLFCDGSIGSHTAALRTPYDDAPGESGGVRFDAGAVAAHVRAAVAAGLPTGFHAIGDAGLDVVLAGYARAAAGSRLPGVHRIEHAEMADAGHVAAAAALGLTVSPQPAFDARWGAAAGLYERRVGSARAATMNDLAAWSAAGVPIALSSDAPVTPLDPWGAVHAAARPHRAAHALSARAAFAAHTRGGHRAAGRPDAGELAPGSPATFAVWEVAGELVVQTPDGRVAGWSTDPRAAVAGLPDLDGPVPQCLRTVVAGVTIFDATS